MANTSCNSFLGYGSRRKGDVSTQMNMQIIHGQAICNGLTTLISNKHTGHVMAPWMAHLSPKGEIWKTCSVKDLVTVLQTEKTDGYQRRDQRGTTNGYGASFVRVKRL